MNTVFLLGNLGFKELDKLPSGDRVLRLRLATNESRKNRDGAYEDHTEWHTVKVFGKRAEALTTLLGVGDRIMVEGNIRNSSYEAKDGTMRYKTEIYAREVHLAGLRGRRAEAQPNIEVDVDYDDVKLGVGAPRMSEDQVASM
ncbi:MAG TPA: single-stranded DNA-binding protein [Polyangiaceae bacterium]|jgi:single-strand DNA-binding protein|nr:single-stranded DNA-binding protein [Polyangiaceae bacterium]